MAKRTAVIDIGSNSVRMVIFERTSRFAFHLIHETKSRVRISEHAYENNNLLQPPALERAYKALKEFQLTISKFKVRKTLCVATSALRDAPNKHDFISKIKKELGLHIQVIDGEKEALLGGIASANLLNLDSALTIDIGGGSTELAYYEDKKVIHTTSLDLGTVRLKELYFDKGDLEGAKRHILREFEKLPKELQHDDIVGIGGTLRALSNMVIEKEEVYYKKLHGFSYKLHDQQEYFNRLLESDAKGLKALGVKKDRLDVIQPGLLILDLLVKHIDAKRITTSGVGVREGLFLSDLLRTQNHQFPKNFNPSVKNLLDRFSDKKEGELYQHAVDIFDLTSKHLGIKEKYKPLFLYAVKLSQVGQFIDLYGANRHGYYLALNGLNYGFTHKEIVLIATIIRFQGKKSVSALHMQNYMEYLPSQGTVNALCLLNTLVQTLSYNFNHGESLALEMSEDCLYINVKNGYLMQEGLKEVLKNKVLPIKIS
jgi:exopolyphosphatase/guanosine-5'-triphosphate,3'-diphosphate pyrophosphatase